MVHGNFLYGFNSLNFYINPWTLIARYFFSFVVFHKCVWCACVCRLAFVVVSIRVHLGAQGWYWESSFIFPLTERQGLLIKLRSHTQDLFSQPAYSGDLPCLDFLWLAWWGGGHHAYPTLTQVSGGPDSQPQACQANALTTNQFNNRVLEKKNCDLKHMNENITERHFMEYYTGRKSIKSLTRLV